MTINCTQIVSDYNARMGTQHSVKSFLAMAYAQNGNLIKTSDWIGISDVTLARIMRNHGVPLRRCGGGHPGRYAETLRQKLIKIPAEELKTMTIKQIKERVGSVSSHHIERMMRDSNSLYKKSPHKNPSPLRDAILDIPRDQIAQMSVDEISQVTGASESHAYNTVWQYDIQYKLKTRRKQCTRTIINTEHTKRA